MFSRCSSNYYKPLDHIYDVCKNHISVGQEKKWSGYWRECQKWKLGICYLHLIWKYVKIEQVI